MTVAVIGAVTLFASVRSWFPPGIAIGLGLMVLGVVIALAPGRNS